MSESSVPERRDLWDQLKRHTSARIGLDRAGVAPATSELLSFRQDHAFARAAVYSLMDDELLTQAFQALGFPVLRVASRAISREQYLQRPDLGRRLANDSAAQLALQPKGFDVVIVVADGLSATAVNRHAAPMVTGLTAALHQRGLSLGPLVLATQARVALADEIGASLNARLVVILIGERPGLTAADSLGAYLTYHPVVGTTDEARNCVSNIRPEGLNYPEAIGKISYLIGECLRQAISGVAIKDQSGELGQGMSGFEIS